MASSEAIGMANSYRPLVPAVFPINELHLPLAQDAYGLSKILQEEIAAGFVRRSPFMSIINLRFGWVLEKETYSDALASVQKNPDSGVRKLFAYVDARDASRACRHAVEYSNEGAEVFFITASDTLVSISIFSSSKPIFLRHT